MSVSAPSAPPAGPPQRLGPRPLALHMMLSLGASTSWPAASLILNGSFPAATPALGRRAETLWERAGRVDQAALASALAEAAGRRQQRFLAGLAAYRRHPYRRDLPEPPCLWESGSSRLLDYGHALPETAPLALVVPSMINRAYVLDLDEGVSFLRWLAGRGIRALLFDWGAPGEAERGMDLDAAILGRLVPAIDWSAERFARKPVLAGYCMGGLLALGAGLARQETTAGLALLATPWDFHAEDALQSRALAGMVAPLWPQLEALGSLPVDLIQALFTCLDPLLGLKKFVAFANLDPDSPRARAFVAVEDWLNDGVALPLEIAKTCIAGWYGENETARGLWQLGGEAVVPAAFAPPALAIVPAGDRIVPPASALALAEALPGAEILRPAAGHIGMMVGSRAAKSVWTPLADWIEARA